MIMRNCAWCGKAFSARQYNSLYCSEKCCAAAKSARQTARRKKAREKPGEKIMDIAITIPNGLDSELWIAFVAGALKRKAEKQGYPLNALKEAGEPYFYTRFLSFDQKTRRVTYRIEGPFSV